MCVWYMYVINGMGVVYVVYVNVVNMWYVYVCCV